MTKFYLVRHGQTLGNVKGISQGITNTSISYLNDTGKLQIKELHQHFDISFADRIIVSPLIRTKQTAAILNQDANLPYQEDSRILEISYGDWDGHLKSELKNDYPDLFSNETGDVVPAYASVAHGETFEDVEHRVSDFMNDITEHFPDESIIVVTHGFTIRSFVVAALQVQDPFVIPEPDNGSVTSISVDAISDQRVLNYFNRVY